MPCSGFTLRTADGRHFLARTMDFDQNPGARLMVIPRGWPIFPADAATKPVASPYAQIAMGVMAGGRALTLDGVNEFGLCGAIFYYPNFARYEGPADGKMPLSPSMALQYALASCRDLAEAEELFRDRASLVADASPVLGVAPPLHFMFSDPSGEAMVVEPDAGGLNIYRDTVGVLANAPGYPWQETNLRNYLAVGRKPCEPIGMENRVLQPISPNTVLWGLPGDYTSVSRFVRTAYLKRFLKQPQTEQEGVAAAFHVLGAVSVPRVRVGAQEAEAGYTMYTCAMAAQSRTYYFHTYDNRRVQAASLDKENLDAPGIKFYEWSAGQDIRWLSAQC
ncbi:MAG: choloylglycine hydrolase family protein [Clostridiales bacterium]|nr:choloylglycine hydrolase family protein [Clostridiales bacterium]